jgi:hypothetical protein
VLDHLGLDVGAALSVLGEAKLVAPRRLVCIVIADLDSDLNGGILTRGQ